MSFIDLNEYEIVHSVEVPVMGDRLVRLQTLEEAIQDLITARNAISAETAAREGIQGFFIQVKPKKTPATAPAQTPADPAAKPPTPVNSEPKASMEGIYLADGTLNINQLIQSAEVLFKAAEYPLARKIYKAIMKTGERPWLAAREIGRCYEAEGKLEAARAQYEESIAYQPLAATFRMLASLLIRLKKDQEAAEILDRALLLKDLTDENRFDFHQTAGNCWARIHSGRDAERHFRRALDLQPDSGEIRCALGAIYLQEGRIDDSERHFEDALLKNPRNQAALSGLGSCALADGNKTAAHAYFARALKIDIVNPTAIFNLVKCAYEIKNYAVATEILEDYIQVAPVNAHLLYSLAGLQYHLGRQADVKATCRKILDIAPKHTGAGDLLNRLSNASA
ncbi:MAG: tetratricopeptide repeat protein [Oligoflexia bacterium]|nr:tetratricopeptide repeat protein [Oligoflexia bacterium]